MRRIALFLLLLSLLATPAGAGQTNVVLAASASRTANGNGTVIMDVTDCRWVTVVVNITAGAATVSTLHVGLQGSTDAGTTWGMLNANTAVKSGTTGAGVTTTALPFVVNEVAAITSATVYVGTYEHLGVDRVRAGWEIAGGGSETFTVTASCR